MFASRYKYTKALEIAKLPSELERQELLEEAISQGLTLSQIRERVKGDQPPAAGSQLQERMKETYNPHSAPSTGTFGFY